MTDCGCQPESFPHWCERHECEKTPHWHRLCQSRDDYFQMWEASRGPGQASGPQFNRPVRMKVTVLIVTHNRLDYTRLAIESVLNSRYPNFEVVVWDNASTDDTQKWLAENLADDSRVSLVLANTNSGAVHPMNVVWSTSDSPLLAKVDNDTLIPADLLERLARCHADSEELGAISGCHFRLEDVGDADMRLREKRGDVEILRQKHVGGCAVMLSRRLFEKFGPIECPQRSSDRPFAESGWTKYQHRLHRAGFVNGYPLPLCYVEHMEDVRSPFCIRNGEHQAYKQSMRNMTLDECTTRFYTRRAAKYFGTNGKRVETYFKRNGLDREPITLFLPLTGHADRWSSIADFLDRQTWPHDRTRLILLDTGSEEPFFKATRAWLADCDYGDVRHLRVSVMDLEAGDRSRTSSTAEFRLSSTRIYNWLAREVTTDYLWILQDDIQPPNDVCERLLKGFDEQTASVAAPYRSRCNEYYHAWDQNHRNYLGRGSGRQVVGGNGFGCVALRSHLFRGVKFQATETVERQFYQRRLTPPLVAKLDWSCECQLENSHELMPLVAQGKTS